MLPLRARWIFALAPTLFSCSDANPIESTLVATSAIQGGSADMKDTFAVGVCSGGPPKATSWCASRCSGTLVSPNLVLTARHCFSKMTKPNPTCGTDEFGELLREGGWVTTRSQIVREEDGGHLVRRIIFPKDPHVCGGDLALLELEDVIEPSEAVPVEPIGRYPMTDHSRYQTVHTLIGYGATSGSDILAGTRHRLDDVPIRCIPDDPAFDICSKLGGGVSRGEYGGGDGPCPGDSGSGSFERSSLLAGRPVTMGVLSRASVVGNECIMSTFTRTDAHWELIVDAARAAAAAGGYAAPSWAIGERVQDAGVTKTDASAPDAGTTPMRDTGPSALCGDRDPCAEEGRGCSILPTRVATSPLPCFVIFTAVGALLRRRQKAPRPGGLRQRTWRVSLTETNKP